MVEWNETRIGLARAPPSKCCTLRRAYYICFGLCLWVCSILMVLVMVVARKHMPHMAQNGTWMLNNGPVGQWKRAPVSSLMVFFCCFSREWQESKRLCDLVLPLSWRIIFTLMEWLFFEEKRLVRPKQIMRSDREFGTLSEQKKNETDEKEKCAPFFFPMIRVTWPRKESRRTHNPLCIVIYHVRLGWRNTLKVFWCVIWLKKPVRLK